MTARPLTIADLTAVSGYTRDQMRGLLDALPSYAVRDTKVRVARQYTSHDLLVVRACVQLESRYKLQRAAVVGFFDGLRRSLSGPRPVSTKAHLLLTFDPVDVQYVDSPSDLREGLLVPLPPIFQAVDEYLLPSDAQSNWSQRQLGFAPRAINAPLSAPVAVAADALTQESVFCATKFPRIRRGDESKNCRLTYRLLSKTVRRKT